MRNNPALIISDSDLGEVMALVQRGRAVPAVIVAAIVQRLAAAEGLSFDHFEFETALAA